MSKPIVATLLALGIGLVAGSGGHAASVPAMGSGITPALAATDTIEQAQYVIKNRGGVVVGPRGGGAVVGPRGGVAVRGGGAVVGPRGGVAVRRGGAVVGPRGGVVVRGGTTVVAPRRAFVGGGGYVGRPAFVRSRGWVRRPYFGTVVGGIALGTILAVAAAPTVAPAPGLCWYWVDDFEERGYWDYC